MSNPRYLQYCFDSFLYYLKTYKNFYSVIRRKRANKFPIYAILRNGEHITFHNKFEALATAHGLRKCYDINNDILIIKKKDLPLVRLYGWEDNGDLFAIFFEDTYGSLPVKNNDVIDIGANIGDSSVYFALKGAKKVIAVEPLPNNYELAKKNIQLNKLLNKIELITAACSSKSGHMLINPEKSGIEAHLVGGSEATNRIEIPLMTLEDILKHSNSTFRILKIDCEGYEYEIILSTACETLQKFSHIQIEYHYGYQNLQEKLEKCGFRISITKPSTFRTPLGMNSRMYIGNLYAEKII